MINDRNAWEAFYRAISVMNRPLLWVPLLAYMAIKLILLAVYAVSAGGGLAAFWALFVGGAATSQLGHYPNNYYLLPVVLSRVDLAMQVLVAVVFQAATIVLFTQAMRKEPLSAARAFATARSRYLPLVVVTLCAAAALFLWFWLQQYLDHTLPVRDIYITASFFVGGLCLQALFIYTMPLALLDDEGPWRALAVGFRAALKDPLRAFLMVFVPFIVTAPALYVSKQAPFLAWRLSPEIVVSIQVFQELLHWPAMVLLMGGLAALFVRRKTA